MPFIEDKLQEELCFKSETEENNVDVDEESSEDDSE